MPTLILLRHANAQAQGPTDFERELSPRGRDQARRVAGHLTGNDLLPDLVLCSAAVRTRQTWAGIARELGEGAPGEVHYLQELYATTPQKVRTLVRERGGQAQTLLIVGHEPIMSMTAADFAGADSDRAAMFSVQAGMSTASLAVIDLPDFAALHGNLRAVLRTH